MSELVERQFPAKALLAGLREMGYSFSTAVADIIDNSLSAGASEIKVFSDPLAEEPYFCILDNGCGMDRKELDNAMLPGSDREGKEDCETELGRFGLGLKSASLSQCREFTVASKKYGKLHAMSFDLDVIEREDKLLLKQLASEETAHLPNIKLLEAYDTGTLVVWTKFDKIQANAKNFEDTFRSVVAEAKKHVELVFHRFYESVSIYFNNKRIERRDPFLLDSEGRTQRGRESKISLDGSEIVVKPYTLPFANTLTSEEKALLGNPKSIFDEQGFYLYRNRRLIFWGSWMRMGIRSELNKLARIQVDIPSSLDSVWSLDVKKSSARIPDKVKDWLRISVQDSVIRSKRTTKFPGTKEQSAAFKVWDRIDEHEGKVRYQVNRENPVITALNDCLGQTESELLEMLLSQLECYLPKYSIINDSNDSLNIVNSGSDSEESRLEDEIVGILSVTDPEKRENMFENVFKMECYEKIAYRKNQLRGRIFGDE